MSEIEREQTCETCYYEEFDESAYPCSRCIRNKPMDDMWQRQRGKSVSEWIPVSERLPEEDGHYLVYAPSYRGGSSSAKENHEGIMFSRFSNGKWSIEHGYYKREGCVRAWMPLPPYREDVEHGI